jgi:eukaryotic-like serine/threonine-protein kinase
VSGLAEQLQAALGTGYAVTRELGGGGMSRVFVAGEIALGREVVVKVLPSDMAAQVSIERFKREILFAARLQHPHIVPLLTAGEADGLPYFTMPYVDGETLRTRLNRTGELPVSDAVRVLREIASALAYAHERGIVHRDIKPDNVLLSAGTAMVTDFGVAKALVASGDVGGGTVTALGMALGTPAYMAPEQATADPNVDHRADIYAFGVVAYELLTGEAPFANRTAQQLIAAHVTETPQHLGSRRASVPASLAALVMRCLEKRPADRPQAAFDIVRALDAVAAEGGASWRHTRTIARSRRAAAVVAGATLIIAAAWITARARNANAASPSLAVLAFDNRDRDSTTDYVAEAMADEVRSALTGLPHLLVKARESSVRFRSSAADLREASSKLAVRALLMGSVAQIGAHLHVTAELVDAPDGNARWSGTFDTQPADLARVRDSIVRAVAATLRAADVPRTRAPTIDPSAHDMFMRAQYITHRMRGPAEFRRAIELYRAAIARDSNYAEAYSALPFAYVFALRAGDGPRDSLLLLAHAALDKARELAPDAPATRRAEVDILVTEYRLKDALRLLTLALADRPNDADIHTALANVHALLGNIPAAIVDAGRARQLDPLSVEAVMSEEYFAYLARDYGRSLDLARQADELEANNVLNMQNVIVDYVMLGRADSAEAVAKRLERIDPRSYGGRSLLAAAYAAAGQWARVDAQRAQWEREPRSSSHEYERIYFELVDGRIDAAMDALQRSVAAHEPLVLVNNIACDPLLDPLKQNPRYAAVVATLGATACPALGAWPIPRR